MKRPMIAALLSATSAAAAFANTNAGKVLYVCATPKAVNLTKAEFEALTWVKVSGVGSHGEVGPSTNILTYDTWDDDVVQKAKGQTNAGDPEIEIARLPTDAGQDIMRSIALTNFNYAFKIEGNDKPNDDVDSKPTIIYNRGLVSGPRSPLGRNEDFDLEIFSLALNQRPIKVDPVDGTV